MADKWFRRSSQAGGCLLAALLLIPTIASAFLLPAPPSSSNILRCPRPRPPTTMLSTRSTHACRPQPSRLQRPGPSAFHTYSIYTTHHTTPHTPHSAIPWQINDALGPAKPGAAASCRCTTDPGHRLCLSLASNPAAAFPDALVRGLPPPQCSPHAAHTPVGHCRIDDKHPA